MPSTRTPKTKTRTLKTKASPARANRSPGQIIQKGDRKWLVRFYTGRDPRTGKRRYVATSVVGTRRDAERELRRKVAEVEGGAYRAPSKLTLAAYLQDQWLAERLVEVQAGSLAPRSCEDYERAVDKLVLLFGHMQLDAIGKADVALLRRQLLERYRPVAAQRAFDVFRMAMKRAFSLDVIAVNPAPAESRIKTPKPKTDALDAKQTARFLDAAETYRHGHYAALFHVLLLGGLRPSEALALRWSDLEGSTLRVGRAVTADAEGRRVMGGRRRGQCGAWSFRLTLVRHSTGRSGASEMRCLGARSAAAGRELGG